MKIKKVLYLVALAYITSVRAEMGDFVLMGNTSPKFSDDEYVLFISKTKKEFKIPKSLLENKSRSIANKEPVMLFKHIPIEEHTVLRKDCIEHFKKKYKENDKDAKKSCL